MKRSLKILIAISCIVIIAIAYYFVYRPNIVAHRELDNISMEGIKSNKARQLAMKMKEEYKIYFDLIYSEGRLSEQTTKKRLQEEGVVLITQTRLFEKQGITNKEEIDELAAYNGECLLVVGENLRRFDPERFK